MACFCGYTWRKGPGDKLEERLARYEPDQALDLLDRLPRRPELDLLRLDQKLRGHDWSGVNEVLDAIGGDRGEDRLLKLPRSPERDRLLIPRLARLDRREK